MRISVDYNDPGFRSDANMLDIRVTLGGRVIHNVLTADSDTGMIVTQGRPVDTIGQPIDQSAGIVVTHGEVEIIENVTERRL